MGLAKEGKVENERLCVIQHPTSIPAQYFPGLFTQVYQGNRWCAARCQVHLDQQPSLFGKARLFFGNWALVQTGANIIFGSSCERLHAKYVPVKVGGIAVCAETIQGGVGG